LDWLAVYAEFDSATSPELFAALTQIPKGKQRATRLRGLALKGLMYEHMASLMTTPPSRSLSANRSAGAGDVFSDPLEE
jgi:hypothetical protein